MDNTPPFHSGSPIMTVRAPAVAGTFYPAQADKLRRELDALIPASRKERALALIAPHAGYAYSGKVAGSAYGRVEIPRDVVILCFNHHGAGRDFAVWPSGAWRTPLGDAPVNEELAKAIKDAFLPADFDEEGHQDEHSGEVQVPFLQVLRSDVRIVPVALSVGHDDRAVAQMRAFGRALAALPAEALAKAGAQDFLVVASTDLNHYEDQKTTVEKDEAAIRAIEALDEAALTQAVRAREVSMCGFAPTVATMAYAKAKGATKAKTVAHATSGDVSGDYDRVVGYAGMVIS
jgi:AmmeMemoRadiSam system protein B